jgi:cell wall-associated NlpC family hydrolase
MFPGPSIKLPPIAALPFGARIAVSRIDGAFAITPAGAHLPAVHLAKLDAAEADPVAVAERFLGTPYLWGGKTSLGLDCSGLVQVALGASGIPVRRGRRAGRRSF